MSENQNKPTKLRLVYLVGFILLLFVVLPFISYTYLKDGLNWRKQAQTELKDFGKIRSVPIIWQDGTKENLLAGKVCVVHMYGEAPELSESNKNILDVCEKLYNQFGFKPGSERNDFRLVMIAERSTPEFKSYYQKMPSSEMSNWVWTGGLGSWTTILKNGFDYYCTSQKVSPYPEYFALTDTSGVIRRFYNAEDPKDVDRMVQQIAILLPK